MLVTALSPSVLPWRRRTRRVRAVEVPPLAPRLRLARAVLVALCAVSTMLLVQLALVSSLQQRSAQQRLYDRFRSQLANLTAPVGPTDVDGRELAIGSPVSLLEVPDIGLRQVVVEGTTGTALFDGPGHRRDTPLPGQEGVAIVMGRRASFGGPFARLAELEPGAVIQVTTGQGVFDYRVTGVRREGDLGPPPPAGGEGRLVLATADGPAYVPGGVLRVDAELDGDAQPGPRRLVAGPGLPPAEDLLGSDRSGLWMLVLWLQVLVVLAFAATWAWHRWGRAQTWVVFTPPLVLVSLHASNGATAVLPNLL